MDINNQEKLPNFLLKGHNVILNIKEWWYFGWRIADTYWPIASITILNLFSAGAGVYEAVNKEYPILFWLLIIISLFGYIIVLYRQKTERHKISVYESVFTNGLSHEEALRKLLALWVKQLKFGHEHRVSIYKHDEAKFYRIGRYCPEPKLSEGGQKVVYEGGIISQAWQSETFVREDLPDPDKDWKSYCKALENEGLALPRNEMKKKRFKARSYYALRIPDAEGSQSMAVILFESTLSRGFDMKALKTLLKLPLGGMISRQVSQRELPSSARTKGY